MHRRTQTPLTDDANVEIYRTRSQRARAQGTVLVMIRLKVDLPIKFPAETGPGLSASVKLMRMSLRSVVSVDWRLASRWMDSKRDHKRVELAFASLELRSICESRRRATNLLGAEAARELAQRLADLSALTSAAELADLFPNDIVDRSRGERALRLQAGQDLVFCAGHVDVPVLEDGLTDWTSVSRLRILALEARHD